MVSRSIDKYLRKPWLLPDIALQCVLGSLNRFNRGTSVSYGWLQSIGYSWGIDVFQRYSSVLSELIARSSGDSVTVLDVGGGSGVIAEFVAEDNLRICVLDDDVEKLRFADKRLAAVAGDATRLPFLDDSVDIVISVDCLEHIPGEFKAAFCSELKRVARKAIIIHCPLDSSDGIYQGSTYDRRFLDWYRLRFGREEPNTTEHLASGMPTAEFLKEMFPGASLSGKQNGEVWLKYMQRANIAYIKFLNGLDYKIRLEKQDNKPPFHAALMVWDKSASSSCFPGYNPHVAAEVVGGQPVQRQL